GGAEQLLVEDEMVFQTQTGLAASGFGELAHGVGFAGGDDEVVRLRLLQHAPHAFDVFASVAPVAAGVEVSEIEADLLAGGDAGNGGSDLAGDEFVAAAGRFVVEEK